MADGEALAAQAGLPWPAGDVASLREAAAHLRPAARDFTDLATSIGERRAASASWYGLTAGRFDASVDNEATALTRVGEGLEDAGRALDALADVVEEAQREVTRLARRVVELDEQVARATQLAPGRGPDRGAAVPGTRLTERLGAELTGLRQRARAAAEAAGERVRRADDRCALTLSTLTCRAPLPGEVAPTLPATPLALAVAGAYAPQYRFDRDEDHFPIDPRAWLAHADLRDRDGDAYFDPRGEDIRHGALARATLPFAYHVTRDGDVQLEYGAFYAFNDFPDDFGFSDHEGDFEPVTVQLGGDGRPRAVDYEAHGHTGAVRWTDAERLGRHPQVYVTHGGHGNHPHAGRYESDWSAGHDMARNAWEDQADGRGERWDGSTAVVDARAIPALRDDARFGEDRDSNPRSFLHPDQGPPPDLDGPQAPAHDGFARGRGHALGAPFRHLPGGPR